MRKRVRIISRQLSQQKIGCLLLTKPANVTYATGFLGDDSWAIITKGRVYLITDSRYSEQARKECPLCKIIERKEPMAEAVAKLVKKFKSIQNITVEDSVSVGQLNRLKKAAKLRFKTTSNFMEHIRSTKDPGEIAAIKKAASIAATALDKTLPYIKPGVTESELAGLLNLEIRKLGAANSFDTIVAFGLNASRAHHQPGLKKLRKNDSILIDFGAKYNGYCSDITRCLTVGRENRFYKKVFDVVEQAQAAAIKMLKAGVGICDVDSAAREVIKDADLPVYGHGTGHGLGLEVHELPVVSGGSKDMLEDGQIITIEPGVYIPGKLGIRIEDDCLITKTGCQILTQNCPHRLSI